MSQSEISQGNDTSRIFHADSNRDINGSEFAYSTLLSTRGVGASVGFNVNIDVLGIGQAIAGAIGNAQNREGFVINLCNTAFYQASQRYNVMVMNLSQGHEDRFSGVKLYASANYGSVIYGVWVFEDGDFQLKGDGGFINWCFRGWYDRNGSYVKFHKP